MKAKKKIHRIQSEMVESRNGMDRLIQCSDGIHVRLQN